VLPRPEAPPSVRQQSSINACILTSCRQYAPVPASPPEDLCRICQTSPSSRPCLSCLRRLNPRPTPPSSAPKNFAALIIPLLAIVLHFCLHFDWYHPSGVTLRTPSLPLFPYISYISTAFYLQYGVTYMMVPTKHPDLYLNPHICAQ
jgi:hypothetical protein